MLSRCWSIQGRFMNLGDLLLIKSQSMMRFHGNSLSSWLREAFWDLKEWRKINFILQSGVKSSIKPQSNLVRVDRDNGTIRQSLSQWLGIAVLWGRFKTDRLWCMDTSYRNHKERLLNLVYLLLHTIWDINKHVIHHCISLILYTLYIHS